MTTKTPELEHGLRSIEGTSAPIEFKGDFLSLMPYDIIAVVFSFLSTRELVTCTVVCHRWHCFIVDNPHILWRQLLLGNAKHFFKCPAFAGEPTDWKTKHIRSFSVNHSRTLVSNAHIREIDMAAIFKRLVETECCYFEHMELYDCPLSIVEFLRYTQLCGANLLSLRISNSYIDARIVSIVLSACPKLVSIDCHDCTPYASSVLSNHPTVTYISSHQLVSMQIVVDETISPTYLGQLLRNCSNLKSLALISRTDWLVRDVIDGSPPEIIFDAIYDVAQQSCSKLESFTFSCLPYWTISEYASITQASPVSLQKLAAQAEADGNTIPKYHIGDNDVVKRCYATLKYNTGYPPPRMKNADWKMLSIDADMDVAQVGYRRFPFTLGSMHNFLADRPHLTIVQLSGVLHKYVPTEKSIFSK